MDLMNPHQSTNDVSPLSHRLLWWLLRRITSLSHANQTTLSRWLARLAPIIAGRRMRVVRANLAICFPALRTSEREALANRVASSTILGLLETLTAWVRPEQLANKHLEIEGLDLLREERPPHQGVLLVGMHFATLDMAGALLSREIPFDVMYKPSRKPFIEALMVQGRNHYFDQVIKQSNVREVVRRLRAGHIVWYAPDQDYGPENAVFAPFFGTPAATITATSRLASMTDAKIIFMSHFRVGEDHYRICLTQAPSTLPSGSELDDATAMNRVIEAEIQKAPEEYWWVHRRFKSAPEGGRRMLYDSNYKGA